MSQSNKRIGEDRREIRIRHVSITCPGLCLIDNMHYHLQSLAPSLFVSSLFSWPRLCLEVEKYDTCYYWAMQSRQQLVIKVTWSDFCLSSDVRCQPHCSPYTPHSTQMEGRAHLMTAYATLLITIGGIGERLCQRLCMPAVDHLNIAYLGANGPKLILESCLHFYY